MPKNNLTPDQVIGRIFEFADSILDRAMQENDLKSSCIIKCEHCCHQPVFVTALEALAVSRAVESMEPNARENLEARIEAYLELMSQNPDMAAGVEATQRDLCGTGDGPSEAEFQALYGPHCPFLEDGLCTIYDSRPLMCREHTSLDDPRKCEEDEPFLGLPEALISEVPAALCSDFVPDEMIYVPVWDFETAAEAALEIPLIEQSFLDQVLSWKAQALGLSIDTEAD